MTTTLGPCLFCYKPIPIKVKNIQKTTKTNIMFYDNNNCDKIVDKEISAVFILKEILELPSSFYEELLKSQGHPSEWFQNCLDCNKIIDKAKVVYKKLMELTKELKLIQKLALQTLLTSIGTKKNYHCRKITIGTKKPVEEIRDFVHNASESRSNLDSEKIFSNFELVADTLIKEEVVPDEEYNYQENCDFGLNSDYNVDQMDIKISVEVDGQNNRYISNEKTRVDNDDYKCKKTFKNNEVPEILPLHKTTKQKSLRPNRKRTSAPTVPTDSEEGSSKDFIGSDSEDEERHLRGKEKKERLQKKRKGNCNKSSVCKNDIKENAKNGNTLDMKCEWCKKTFPSLRAFKYHNRCHHYEELNLPPIKCKECDIIFKSLKHLSHHKFSTHQTQFTHVCNICSIGLFDKQSLEKHMKDVHSVGKSFYCEYCPKECVSQFSLENHIVLEHTKDFPEGTKCEICDRQFARVYQLKEHAKIHSNLKPLVCEICGFSCIEKHNFRNHQRGFHYEELGLEPFKCTYCDKIYGSLKGLKHHINIQHKNEWPFPCEESSCGAKFQTRAALGVHTRSKHTGERPFPCSFCDRRFFTKAMLVSHFQKHTKNFTCKCHLCPKGYDRNYRLKRHLKQAHKIHAE